MKRIILLFFIAMILSCRYDQEPKIELEINLEKLMEAYITQEPCEDCLYEIYIDKKASDRYQMMFYKGSNSLTFEEYVQKKKHPLFYTYIKNKKVYVYSGAENYFSVKEPLVVQKEKKKTDKTFKVWVVSDSAGIKKVEIFNQAYPFLQLPEKKVFKPN